MATDFLDKLLAQSRPPVEDVFQPKNLEQYIGQNDTKELLRLAINAAKLEHRSLPNFLISGGFGLGKSVLAKLTLEEARIPLRIVDGSSANKSMPRSGTIIVDEIHNLVAETCDSLSLLMDSGAISIVGCTTDPGKLPAAFRSRFRLLHLITYSIDELSEIAGRVCARKGVTASPDILKLIAQRSRFNARQVISYLSIIFDLLAVNHKRVIEEADIVKAFTMLKVDKLGYLQRDKSYVSAMPTRPVGLGWLSAVLGIDETTIENEIEPFLLQTGVIDRTPRGRIKLKEI